MDFDVIPVRPEHVSAVAAMVGELLAEIMGRTGTREFQFDLAATEARLGRFIDEPGYFAFVAVHAGEPVGFAALYEGRALYTEGVFGTLAELYVRPEYRSRGVGSDLLQAVKKLGTGRGWTRLEVTTPPLPEFERTLQFYVGEAFTIAGGRKLKAAL